MPGQVREGWYEDPASRHEYRWFSEGSPTDLVMDGPTTSKDALSISDPALYTSMDLATPPDNSPPPHSQNAAGPAFEPLDLVFGQSYADVWRGPHAWPVLLAGLVPFLIGMYLVSSGSLVLGIVALALSPVIGALVRRYRMRQFRRLRQHQSRR